MSKLNIQLMQSRKFRLPTTLAIIIISVVGSIFFPSYSSLSQTTYNAYMPTVKSRIIAEQRVATCRWLYAFTGTTNLTYKWGTNLQNPGTTYRNAYETAVADWNAVAIKLRFVHSGSGNITFNTFNMPGGAPGQATPSCSPSGTITESYLVELNTNNAASPGNPLRAITGHELGHSLSIGHIPGKDFISLLGYNPDANAHYIPQQSDIDFVNQFYP